MLFRRRETVDYSYLNQPVIKAEVIDGGDPERSEEQIELRQDEVDHERLVDNYRHFPDRLQLLKDTRTGNEVAAYWANLDAAEDNTIALITTRQSSLATNGGNRREYALVAAMNPNYRFAVLDSAGTGPSNKLPKDIMLHAIQTGRFEKAGAIYARALANEGIHPRALIGVGLGGRFAISTATSIKSEVEKVGAIDPEGQSDLGVASQSLRMVRELVKHERAYREATQDPYANPSHNFPDIPEAWEKKQPVRVARNLTAGRSIPQIFFQMPLALRRGGQAMAADMEAMLRIQENARMDYVSPQKSELLKHPDDPLRVLGHLSTDAAARVRIIRVPEATHYFTAAHPRLVGAIVREIIERDKAAA